MPRLVVYGRPGSGKSTYVETRRAVGDFVWDWDRVAVLLFGAEDLSDANHSLLMRMFDEAVRGIRLSAVANAWVIVTGERWAREIASRIGGKLHYVDTPADECVRRLELRDPDTQRRKDRIRIAKEWC